MTVAALSTAGQIEAANTTPTNCPASTATTLKGVKGGGIGDYLKRLIIVPLTGTPGLVTLKDGGGAAITVFQGGVAAATVSDLNPIQIDVGAFSAAGAWTVTTGAAVSVVAIGDFQ